MSIVYGYVYGKLSCVSFESRCDHMTAVDSTSRCCKLESHVLILLLTVVFIFARSKKADLLGFTSKWLRMSDKLSNRAKITQMFFCLQFTSGLILKMDGSLSNKNAFKGSHSSIKSQRILKEITFILSPM